MGGKGKAPPPVDPGKAIGEYMFGRDFATQYQGVTDPRLQERIIGAEEQFRPRYAALELQDIATYARGLEDTPGVFDLLEEQSRRAAELQREQLQLQREADVEALQEFAPQAVEAYRAADPRSAELADLASQRAQEDLGLRQKGQELLASELEAANTAERKLLETGTELADLTPTEQEALLKKRGMEFAQSTGQLTPLEKRRAEQQARIASVARGRAMDKSSLYGEMQARMAEEL